MTSDIRETIRHFTEKNKTLLLLLAVGLMLILLPNSQKSDSRANQASDDELRLQSALEAMTGVGNVHVLLAETSGRNAGYTGAVVVCEGAESPEIRLQIVEAVSAFTGLGSNKIMISKMKNAGRLQQ